MKTAIIFLVCLAAVFANPDGAPVSACFTMLPDHGTVPRPLPNPVRIVLSTTTVQAGGTVTITIESINPAFQFRGFQVQPRNVVAPNAPLGTIVASPTVQTVLCSGGLNTGTHITNALRNTQTVQWVAPSFTGGVRVQ